MDLLCIVICSLKRIFLWLLDIHFGLFIVIWSCFGLWLVGKWIERLKDLGRDLCCNSYDDFLSLLRFPDYWVYKYDWISSSFELAVGLRFFLAVSFSHTQAPRERSELNVQVFYIEFWFLFRFSQDYGLLWSLRQSCRKWPTLFCSTGEILYVQFWHHYFKHENANTFIQSLKWKLLVKIILCI